MAQPARLAHDERGIMSLQQCTCWHACNRHSHRDSILSQPQMPILEQWLTCTHCSDGGMYLACALGPASTQPPNTNLTSLKARWPAPQTVYTDVTTVQSDHTQTPAAQQSAAVPGRSNAQHLQPLPPAAECFGTGVSHKTGCRYHSPQNRTKKRHSWVYTKTTPKRNRVPPQAAHFAC